MKKRTLNSRINPAVCFFILFFIGALAFSFLVPYQHDDWAWGGQIGLDRLASRFDNYSGRYAGNLIILALTRSVVLHSFVMAAFFTGIIWLIYKITGSEKNGYVIASVLLLLMPLSLFSQSVAWVSGFANYVTSATFALVYIYATADMYGERSPGNSAAKAAGFAVLGFVSSLIVEHITLYCIVLAVYVIVFIFIRYRKVLVQNVAYLAGTAAGALLMFSNSCYSSVRSGEDAYRSVGSSLTDTVKLMVKNYHAIVKYGVINNVVLNVVIAVLAVALFVTFKKKYKNRTARALSEITVCIAAGFAVFSFMICIAHNDVTTAVKCIYFLFTAGYAASLLVFFFLLPVDRIRKTRLIFFLMSIAVMAAPLLVVSPVSERCFYPTYVMFTALAVEMYANLSTSVKEKVDRCKTAGECAAATAGLYLILIFAVITGANNKRIRKFRSEIDSGSRSVEVQRLPYEEYMHFSSPETEEWNGRYKMYYGIPEDVEVVFTERDSAENSSAAEKN